MNTRLTHVRANVPDLKRAVDWYTDVLGFRVEATWPSENPSYAHFASDEGATFAVAVASPAPAAARFNFTVEGVDRLWEKLNGSADVTKALADTPWGSRKFTIRDPDGNELSFVEG